MTDLTEEEKTKSFNFISYSVNCVREALEGYAPEDSTLVDTTDQQIYDTLEYCLRSGFCIWVNDDGTLDIEEFERIFNTM